MTNRGTVVSVDFEVTDPGTARISVFDRGFLYGDSVYEVVRTYGGMFFAFGRHFRRLARSAEALGFALPFGEAALRRHCLDLARRRGPGDCYLRVIVTRGTCPVTLAPPEDPVPLTVVIAGPLPDWPEAYYTQGITLVTVGVLRNPRGALNPMIKSGNYLNNVMAALEARRAGAVDAVMLNTEGQVTESSTANIFMVSGGVLCTPPVEVGILDGISRHVVITLAEREGIPFEARPFGVEELHAASECFLTSTTREIMPVRRVDGYTYPAPGPFAARFMKAWRAYVAERKNGEVE